MNSEHPSGQEPAEESTATPDVADGEAAIAAEETKALAPVDVAPPEVVYDRKPIEHWATKRGHVARQVGNLTVHGDAWVFAGVKQHKNWATGQEVTEGEYDAAVEGMKSISNGGGPR